MKILTLIFSFLMLIFVMPVNAQILKNKAIICEEINNDFKSMYGFKFIDEDSVQILIKNSDTVDVLVDNILKYNSTEEIIYIIGLDDNRMINYGFNIFRDNLNVWAFNVTALEPFFEGHQCEIYIKTPFDFKSFFNKVFRDEIKYSIKTKKI
tara:strand:- start:584 stop:1039 length:456 start_codon:yes stop_codon:yes gene_type:complete